jgi:rare lipoprotein A
MPLRVKRHRLPHADAWLTCAACASALLLGACGTVRPPAAVAPEAGGRPATQAAPAARTANPAPALPPAGSGRGGYYLDDGPGEAPPPNLEAIPNAEPKVEPYSTRGNKPYVVFGKTYTPVTDNLPMKQRGVGSWYGKKFHGQKTSSGELYDMYKMTAAHPTLPIPSYARVTNLKNGRQVIVRVNDRGPFHSSRIIDLSYTAALKLGYIGHGSTDLEVERLLPDEIARINAQARNPSTPVTAMVPATTVAMAVPGPTPPVIGSMMSPSAPIRLATAAPNAPPATMVPATATVTSTTPSNMAASAALVSTVAATDNLTLEDVLKRQAADTALPSSAVENPGRMAAAPAGQAPLLTAGPTAVTAAPADSSATLAAGFYLQFGAYSRSANADQLRLQLLQHWPAGLPLPEVRQSGVLYRLFSGPFPNREAASLAVGQLGENPPARPLIVVR